MNEPRRFQLCQGPQDGAHVIVYAPEPVRIFVQREWQGDGNATWGREKSERFPACYLIDPWGHDKYTFLE